MAEKTAVSVGSIVLTSANKGTSSSSEFINIIVVVTIIRSSCFVRTSPAHVAHDQWHSDFECVPISFTAFE
jgi:hypothetical protein